MYDYSTGDYKFRYPHKLNPRYLTASKEPMKLQSPLEEFRPSKWLTAHGSLDLILAMAKQHARAEPKEIPELSMAPTITEEEALLLAPIFVR